MANLNLSQFKGSLKHFGITICQFDSLLAQFSRLTIQQRGKLYEEMHKNDIHHSRQANRT